VLLFATTRLATKVNVSLLQAEQKTDTNHHVLDAVAIGMC